MVTQAERRAETIAAILVAARNLFGSQGFEKTSIDEIAAKAGVAKGAVYHHFASKEEIFARVLDEVQRSIATAPVPKSLLKLRDPIAQATAAVLRYLTDATQPGVKQILLIDGPAVLGWAKWREIDDHYFAAGARVAMGRLLGSKASASQIDAATHLLLGAVMEAALVCATAKDPKKTARELSAALGRMLEGLLK